MDRAVRFIFIFILVAIGVTTVAHVLNNQAQKKRAVLRSEAAKATASTSTPATNALATTTTSAPSFNVLSGGESSTDTPTYRKDVPFTELDDNEYKGTY